MKKQHIIYRFCLAGYFISLILLPMFRFDLVTATTDTNKSKNSAHCGNQPRLKGPKPGGDTNTVKGSILIPEESNVAQEDSPDPTPLIARFRREVCFQVKVWDPSKGTKDGDGIERIEISIRNSNQDTGKDNEIYNHTEKRSPYCFFEGGYPCGSINKFWPSGQPIENGQYSAYIEIYRKNISQPAQWFFRFEIQRPS
ncbi:MAG: hypothetical protein KME52_22090 [Desmonostoc geniculatum HA4340-LM1]|jgi:hypothetical protein|nr:hypothetical protein [Desmonostoc geniculatum HA4340-LM1]